MKNKYTGLNFVVIGAGHEFIVEKLPDDYNLIDLNIIHFRCQNCGLEADWKPGSNKRITYDPEKAYRNCEDICIKDIIE